VSVGNDGVHVDVDADVDVNVDVDTVGVDIDDIMDDEDLLGGMPALLTSSASSGRVSLASAELV
jgi:hypothetical protein